MISFRFHLVSIAAVFMSLALGVVLGTAFINDGIVNRLDNDVKKLRDERNSARAEVGNWGTFGDEAEDAVAEGRLEGVRVLTIVPEGLRGSLPDKLHSLLARAGAIDAGTLTLDNAWSDKPAPTDQIAAALGVNGPSSIDSVTATAAERLARELAAGGGPTLPALVDANLMRVDGGDPATTPGGASRFVVIDNGPPEGLLEPLTRALATEAPKSVLIADASADDQFQDSLVGILRSDPKGAQFSTVDHFSASPGRIAAILALREFARGGTGDYGSGPGKDRAAPPAG